MRWICMYCTYFSANRRRIIEHYRAVHGHFGRNCPLPCIYSDSSSFPITTISEKPLETTWSFFLWRKEIVEDEPPVADVRERWPALFSERQIEAEFARLTSVDLKDSLFAGLDKYLLRFLGLYRARMGLVELNSLLRTLDIDGSNQRQRAVVLMGLPHYLKDGSTLYKKVQVTDAEEDWTKGMAVGILMVAQIDELVRFAVVLEEEIIFPSLSDFPTVVALLMGLLFALNIDYPRGLRYTFEVIQKVLMDIGGGQCSALVHGLRNRLFRKKM